MNPQLPSIASSRAMLRARISELTAQEANRPVPFRLFAGAFGFAALAIVIVVASILAIRRPGTQNEHSPLVSVAGSILPKRNLTPGAVRRASLQEVCAVAQEKVIKAVSPSLRHQVLEEYGIPVETADDYEVDYLITPGLGGDDDIRNLWPEPYHTPMWNARRKDALEERLHEMVCSHQLDLKVAQKEIASNWIAAYLKYIRAAAAKG